MWDFFQTVRYRHSVRAYKPELPVTREQLHAVLETACAAPSAGDLQSYRIVVVQDAGRREALSMASGGQSFITQAPLCLVFCADPDRAAEEFHQRGRSLYAIQDATIAATYAQLACVAAGLGTTWVGEFDEAAVRATLDLPPELTPVALLSVGHPAELPEPTRRRRLDEMVIHAG
ncbi:MAG TPA: nitroreductase family protein [Gammaproteobacteria bacterium]|nr:nitroreductase family protein [Gammaproteobacteria bacterium]